MCGICGIVSARPDIVREDRLRRMTGAMVHRGPDDEGIALFPAAGLGLRRLSIIDLEGSHQPIRNEDGSIWSVCNGEIYNFLELRASLAARGHRFYTQGDAEVVVHAYEEWGPGFVGHLRGMFGLAVWDERRGRALLARDRIGIKPLFYAVEGGALVFGSELNAVRVSGLISEDLDPAALNLYLSLMYIPAPFTIFSAIRKLPPASVLTYDGREARVERFWSPPDEAVSGDEEEKSHELFALLRESVRLHLQSDVPLGFFLSGGLDSSALVALAAMEGAKHPLTFSVGFEERSHNELGYARIVADRFSCDHHPQTVRADAAGVLPRIVTALGEPFGDSSVVPTYYISETARRAVKVVVGGDGGDELFAGYEWTRRQRVVEKWRTLPPWMRRAAAAVLGGHGDSPSGLGRIARFLQDADRPPLDGYLRRVSCLTPGMKASVYTGPLKEHASRDAARAAIAGYFGGVPDAVVAMNRADFGVYLPDDDLCKVDRMTMLHSLEGRVPLLDHKLAEFSLSLPMSLKMRGTTTKFLLKRALAGVLPPETLAQRKQGFAIPVDRWMREDLHAEARRLLLDPRAETAQFLRRDAVEGMLERHRTGRARLGHPLWLLLVLETWLRTAAKRPEVLPAGVRLSDL